MKRLLALFITLSMLFTLLLPCAAAQTEEDDRCPGWGDMDGDGEVTSGDARLALRQSVRLENFPEEACYNCDIDKDGEITSSDARFILRLSVNLEERPAHEVVTFEGKAPTCSEPGLSEGKSCAVCGKELQKPEPLDPVDHEIIPGVGISPTCTEPGMTDGEFCAICGMEVTPQEPIEALGHLPIDDPSAGDDVCVPAKICERCKQELTPAVPHKAVEAPAGENTCVPAKICEACSKVLEPEVTHDFPAGASITVEKGILCTRCGKARIPSFNDLVNGMKDGSHRFSTFSKTVTNITNPKISGVLAPFIKGEFEKEFADNMGETVDYTVFDKNLAVNGNNFELIGSDKVSELTDGDVDSVKTEETKEIGFLKNLPDSYTAGRNDFDLTALKAKQQGDMLKVTVKIKPDRYSEAADQNGSRYIKKIYSAYGEMVDSAMKEFTSFGGDMMKCESDSLSNATITYYFDKATLAPIAAEYAVDMQIDQKMDMFITQTGEISNISTLSMSFDISTVIDNYFFFDAWFD